MRDELTPVVVGVGQVLGNRARDPAAAREPAGLILDAVVEAGLDARAGSLLAALDSIDTVRTTAWAYADLAGRVAAHVGARPTHAAHRHRPAGGGRPLGRPHRGVHPGRGAEPGNATEIVGTTVRATRKDDHIVVEDA